MACEPQAQAETCLSWCLAQSGDKGDRKKRSLILVERRQIGRFYLFVGMTSIYTWQLRSQQFPAVCPMLHLLPHLTSSSSTCSSKM